jgi:transcriptional regulator with XRE-family HTH domain
MAVSVSVRIKTVRKALGLSQRAFCKGIFLSHSFYAQIESGTRKANERIYELISTKYKVNKDWLLTGKGEMFSGPSPDVELEQLIEIYKELDPLFREYIMLQIKQLLNVQKRGKKGENKAVNT